MAEIPNSLAKYREIDPGARELWNVQGPRDASPSRIIGILYRNKGVFNFVIAHEYDTGDFEAYVPEELTGPVAAPAASETGV